MKSLTLLLIPLLFLSSCTIDWNDEKDKKISDLNIKIQELEKSQIPTIDGESSSFISKNFWVSFESFYGTWIFSLDAKGWINTKIQFIQKPISSSYYIPYWDPLEIIYRRTERQTPEERIMELVEETGNNPQNCRVIKMYESDWFEHLSVDLKEKNISYSKNEKEQLEWAKKDSAESGWPAYEFTQAEIYNNHLRKECWQYAIWQPPATSRTYGSYFISSSGSITMLYHPSWADPSIIENGTLKLFDPISAVNP